MKVLVADKFEQSGLDGLRALGCEVSYQPDVKDAALVDAVCRAHRALPVICCWPPSAPLRPLSHGRPAWAAPSWRAWPWLPVAPRTGLRPPHRRRRSWRCLPRSGCSCRPRPFPPGSAWTWSAKQMRREVTQVHRGALPLGGGRAGRTTACALAPPSRKDRHLAELPDHDRQEQAVRAVVAALPDVVKVALVVRQTPLAPLQRVCLIRV